MRIIFFLCFFNLFLRRVLVWSDSLGIFCVYCTGKQESLNNPLLFCILFSSSFSSISIEKCLSSGLPTALIPSAFRLQIRAHFSVVFHFCCFFYFPFLFYCSKQITTTANTRHLKPCLSVQTALMYRYVGFLPPDLFFTHSEIASTTIQFCVDEAGEKMEISWDNKFHTCLFVLPLWTGSSGLWLHQSVPFPY